MKIKSFFKAAAITLFMALSIPVISNAATANSIVIENPADDKNKEVLARIVARVAEIENMDKSNLSPSEKKALRKELKQMKATADGLNSRVYISVGAIIIAILLLILILR